MKIRIVVVVVVVVVVIIMMAHRRRRQPGQGRRGRVRREVGRAVVAVVPDVAVSGDERGTDRPDTTESVVADIAVVDRHRVDR